MQPRCMLAVVIVAVAGCGGGTDKATSTRQPPSVASTTTEQQQATAAPGLGDAQPLTPGHTYATQLFRPAVSLTVPSGKWATEEGDSPQHISFAAGAPHGSPGGGLAQAIVELHRIDRVFDPVRGGRIPGDEVPLRGSFATWLRHHPHLRVLRDRPTRLLGLSGVALDVASRSAPPRTPEDCGKNGPRCVPLLFDGLDYMLYTTASRGRFTVLKLPGGGELVVEEFVEPARGFAKGLRLLRPLLQGLQVTPAG